jgi:Ornithine cyclodeaminase/mu-crystallin family
MEASCVSRVFGLRDSQLDRGRGGCGVAGVRRRLGLDDEHRGAVARDDVTELGAVLVGAADGRRSAGDITLFDSTGLAIQDLAVAKTAYTKAAELDLQSIKL